MARNIIQRFTRENKPVDTPNYEKEAKRIIQGLKRDVPKIKTQTQNLKREIPKIPSFSTLHLISQIKDYTALPDSNYYLGFGGMGDALLLLAECWNDINARVIFFANHQPLVRSFFSLFGRSVFLHDNIMGTDIAGHIYDYIIRLPTFKQSAHLADGLNYGDWTNEDKYIPRIKKHVEWIDYLGKENYDKKVLVLAPSGSHRDINRQRYLTSDEYNALSNKYLSQNYQVFSVGSISDLHHFGMIDHPNFSWLHSDKIYTGSYSKDTNLLTMLRTVHSADLVLSTDTFLKTYALLCGIPTTVIQTRWNGVYRNYGEDVTDWIFLNQKMWPNLKLEPIENLL